jgi:AcrR family transcriptional regulator
VFLWKGTKPLERRLSYVYSDNMKSDDNSVNIESVKRGYHHGDLRAALVAVGLDLLKQRDADALSLREVARGVGVSATAVYRHFPDKQSLLLAMCAQGAEAMAAEQQAAMEAVDASGGVGRAGFDAMGEAYVRFALANPALFRLMMSVHPADGYFSGEALVVNAAMQLLRKSVDSLLPESATAEARRIAAIHAWSMVHGMAMLMLEGLIPTDDTIIASISRSRL